jgi:CspA family cold shock protein
MKRTDKPEPPEPRGTRRSTIGRCKWWKDEKGYGCIEADATRPWDIWCIFSALPTEGRRALIVGQRVEVEYERADQDSFKYRAISVRLLD